MFVLILIQRICQFDFQLPPQASWNGPLDGLFITYKRIKHGERVISGEETVKSTVKGHITKFNARNLKPWSTYLVTACGFNRKKTGSQIVYGKTGNLTVDTHLARMYFFAPALFFTIK